MFHGLSRSTRGSAVWFTASTVDPVPKKNDQTNSSSHDALEFETYVIKSTRKSKVPTKVEDPKVLRFAASEIKRQQDSK